MRMRRAGSRVAPLNKRWRDAVTSRRLIRQLLDYWAGHVSTRSLVHQVGLFGAKALMCEVTGK